MATFVLIFIWWPVGQVGTPPQTITQTFTSQQRCEDAGEVMTRELDIPEDYINNYAFEHRQEPKRFCVAQ